MSEIVLQWRQQPPPIALRWLGFDDMAAAALPAPGEPSRAAVIGPPGKSAYQQAIDEGFEGTFDEWIATLRQDLAGYLHEQGAASAQWIVNHNLGRRPAAVAVLSPGGLEVEAAIAHVSENQLRVSFALPASGSVLIQ